MPKLIVCFRRALGVLDKFLNSEAWRVIREPWELVPSLTYLSLWKEIGDGGGGCFDKEGSRGERQGVDKLLAAKFSGSGRGATQGCRGYSAYALPPSS
jgi:hypothetical protein